MVKRVRDDRKGLLRGIRRPPATTTPGDNRLRRREEQRGAAAIEFALSLLFLIPLMLGTLDYGYYFWVAVNATEAAREGSIAMARTGNAAGRSSCSDAAASPTVAATTGAGQTRALAYLTNNASTLVPYTTVTVSCVDTTTSPSVVPSISPSWRIVVQIDFPPVVGWVRAGMPASTTPGRLRFKSTPLVSR